MLKSIHGVPISTSDCERIVRHAKGALSSLHPRNPVCTEFQDTYKSLARLGVFCLLLIAGIIFAGAMHSSDFLVHGLHPGKSPDLQKTWLAEKSCGPSTIETCQQELTSWQVESASGVSTGDTRLILLAEKSCFLTSIPADAELADPGIELV